MICETLKEIQKVKKMICIVDNYICIRSSAEFADQPRI